MSYSGSTPNETYRIAGTSAVFFERASIREERIGQLPPQRVKTKSAIQTVPA